VMTLRGPGEEKHLATTQNSSSGKTNFQAPFKSASSNSGPRGRLAVNVATLYVHWSEERRNSEEQTGGFKLVARAGIEPA